MENSQTKLNAGKNSELCLDSLGDGVKRNNKDDDSEIDVIFKEIGEFGKYQLFVFVLIGFIISVTAITSYITVFTDDAPDFRCKLPMLDNDTYEITSTEQQRLVDLYIPRGSDFSINDRECKLISYETNSTSNVDLEKCDTWVYSKQYFQETIVSRVCIILKLILYQLVKIYQIVFLLL